MRKKYKMYTYREDMLGNKMTGSSKHVHQCLAKKTGNKGSGCEGNIMVLQCGSSNRSEQYA